MILLGGSDKPVGPITHDGLNLKYSQVTDYFLVGSTVMNGFISIIRERC